MHLLDLLYGVERGADRRLQFGRTGKMLRVREFYCRDQLRSNSTELSDQYIARWRPASASGSSESALADVARYRPATFACALSYHRQLLGSEANQPCLLSRRSPRFDASRCVHLARSNEDPNRHLSPRDTSGSALAFPVNSASGR